MPGARKIRTFSPDPDSDRPSRMARNYTSLAVSPDGRPPACRRFQAGRRPPPTALGKNGVRFHFSDEKRNLTPFLFLQRPVVTRTS